MTPTRLADWWLRLTARSDLALSGDETGRFLPWMVAVMVFLATLALAAALAVGSAASRWQHDLNGSATVQIAATDTGNIEARVAAALDLLRRTPGIRRADPVSPAAAAALLAPWLGDAATLGDLPMPRLIDVGFDVHQVDTAELGRQLAAAVPGASFDDHRRWVEGLAMIAHWIMLVAIAIVVLVGSVATLSVIFAVRSGLAVHRDVIEVLHLIGAHDDYIASNFARHALWTGLRGGVLGSAVAIAGLVALSYVGHDTAPGMLPGLTLETFDWVVLILLVPLAAILAAWTARSTVLRALARLI